MAKSLGSVTLTDVVRYAGASGDMNPIHYDPAFARDAGYADVFSMGALHGGWLVSHAFGHGAEITLDGPTAVRLRFRGIVELGVDLAARVDVENARVDAELMVEDQIVVTVRVEPMDRAPEPVSASDRVDEQLCVFPVELGSVRRFAEAVRWPHEVGSGLAVPPTFFTVLSFWLSQPDPIERVGFDRARTLLGETSVELVRGPVRAGETFDVREFVTNRRVKRGSSGTLELVDLVAELSDSEGLRVVYRNTFVLTPDPRESGSSERLPTIRLKGSRDPKSQEVFFPPRALSVDGRLDECEDVDLADNGVLWSWTTFDGQAFGQVDLEDGVRLQGPMLGDEHEIGATYRTVAVPDGGWCFARA